MKTKSVLFEQARGKIGNVVASENRNGQYFRTKVNPKNPKTAKQVAVRSAFTSNSKDWRDLTDPERLSFTTVSKTITLHDTLGNKYAPTGQQLFVGLNGILAAVGDAPITEAPGVADMIPALVADNLAIKGGTAAVAANGNNPAQPATPAQANLFFDAGTEAGTVIVSATAPYSAGRSFVGPSQYRQIEVAAAGPNTPLDFTAAYEAVFGPPKTGTKISVKVRMTTKNGFAGAPTILTATVS